ncbi:MAG: laminin B domain-containing protein [Candidatus Latescibacteria bacterium]|nr:laminin B domain-containing protein [Candidatus Latescibacterota bacterium]
MFRISSPLLLIVLLAIAADSRANLYSGFGDDDEGWIVRDLNCNNSNQVYATHAVAWTAVGGDPAGHVTHHDVTNYCSYFSAPAAFLGDRSAYAGGTLEFSLNSTERDWQNSDTVVLIGAGLVVCHELPELPPMPPSWRHYAVPLDAGEFTYNNAAGAAVAPADFAAVLADLDFLMLPAEFGSEIEETVGLDSVAMRLPATATPAVPDGAFTLAASPNPFNPATRIAFSLPESAPVRLTVHDAAGRLVAVLRDGQPGDAGDNEVTWRGVDDRGRALPAGVYLVRMCVLEMTESIRILLVR